jgi:MFS family permease
MRPTLTLFRSERRALPFFGAQAQSALGTGAGYVALLLLAYDRNRSAWAISLVLAADLIPSMLLGPLLGAVADRISRKTCMVTADILRALAFAGVALVDDFVVMVVLAVVAGVGNAIYRAASQAAVPTLVAKDNVPAALAVFGAVEDVGFTLGPALAAGLLLLSGPAEITGLNAATFAISAVVLAALSFGAPPENYAVREPGSPVPSLLHDAREGMRTAAGTPGLRAILVFSSITLVSCGIFNVGELLFAETELGAGDSGFSLLVMIFGTGFLCGSLIGAKGGAPAELKRGYEAGILLLATGFIGCALAPTVAVATLTFGAAGVGNGLVLVHERLIIQALIPDALLARVYGTKDALTAWAFGLAFAGGGGLIAAFGVRSVLLAAGVGTALTAGGAVWVLRSAWEPETGEVRRRARSVRGFHGGLDRVPGEDGANTLVAGDGWLALLDDLQERPDH